MPRHSNSRFYDPVIDFTYFLYATLVRLFMYINRGVDRRIRSMVAYFQATPPRTIITDFLATATVIGILLFPIAMAILWIVITF